MPLLFPSGGLVYHWRALRYARLWAPFRRQLADWLQARLPAGEELVLVGPSAGHCLPLRHLVRFQRIVALEPDPLARSWLRARLPVRELRFETEDLLLQPLLDGTPGIEGFLAERPRSAVLFCNVLGQLHFGLGEPEQARFQLAFRERVLPRLSGRHWASFHDRWSLDVEARSAAPLSSRAFARLPEERRLTEALFGSVGPPLTLLDHGTSELFPQDLPRLFLPWQITPRALHWVEALGGV